MSVFFVDSNGELWFDKVEKLGIEYISMPYTIDNVEYFYDLGKNTDFKDFFNKIRKGSMPITSALNPQNYIDIFTPFLEQGNDIIYVTFSNKMSGTFDHLNKAIEELKVQFPDRKIQYVDTRNISLGAGMVGYYAALEYKNGATDEEIIRFVEKFRDEICEYFIVDDLMHLKRGGRLSTFSAAVGTLLGIKPVLGITEEGKIDTITKVNGRKKSLNALVDMVKQKSQNLADYPVAIMHADCEEDALYVKNKLIELYGEELNFWIQPIGPVIGTHCGPGTVGIVFHGKK